MDNLGPFSPRIGLTFVVAVVSVYLVSSSESRVSSKVCYTPGPYKSQCQMVQKFLSSGVSHFHVVLGQSQLRVCPPETRTYGHYFGHGVGFLAVLRALQAGA